MMTTNEELTAEVHRLEGKIIDLEDSLRQAWPDGSETREKWMSHVWYWIPPSVLCDACIRAKEGRSEPFYLPFIEPEGWKPKADFTCWICGQKHPHPHSQAEIDAARKTLEVFRENVWKDLCQQSPTVDWLQSVILVSWGSNNP